MLHVQLKPKSFFRVFQAIKLKMLDAIAQQDSGMMFEDCADGVLQIFRDYDAFIQNMDHLREEALRVQDQLEQTIPPQIQLGNTPILFHYPPHGISLIFSLANEAALTSDLFSILSEIYRPFHSLIQVTSGPCEGEFTLHFPTQQSFALFAYLFSYRYIPQ